MTSLYANPKYYEIAFSYRDIPQEVQVMTELICRYSLIQAKRVLEFGCGNSPHMEELLRLGYTYVGIDLSPEMLEYSRQKAEMFDCHIELHQQNMVDFSLDTPVDFAYIMLGSLYVQSTEELVSHFASVSKALNPGGLYLLDWCVDFTWLGDTDDSWVVEQDGIVTYVQHSTRLINFLEQTFEETIDLAVDDHGTTHRLRRTSIRRAIYPQEFFLVTGEAGFEYIGGWNNWNLHEPLQGTEELVERPIMVLRRA